MSDLLRLHRSTLYQCRFGHIVCSVCYGKLDICGECRVKYETPIRNLAMENMLAGLKLPCANALRGCPQVVEFQFKVAHEKICEYQEYHCPAALGEEEENCIWSGSNPDSVREHLNTHHGNIVQLRGQTAVFTIQDVESSASALTKWKMVQSCLGRDFVFSVLKQKKLDSSDSRY